MRHDMHNTRNIPKFRYFLGQNLFVEISVKKAHVLVQLLSANPRNTLKLEVFP